MLGHIDSHLEKSKVNSQFCIIYQNKFQIVLKYEIETIKLLEKYRGFFFVTKGAFKYDTKPRNHKRGDKFNYRHIKMKTFDIEKTA